MPSEAWENALYDSARALQDGEVKVSYVILGSAACFVHGVKYPDRLAPSDIDIVTNDITSATEAILGMDSDECTVELIQQSPVVRKFKITPESGTSITLDLVHDDDFGMDLKKSVNKNELQVMSVLEILHSIYLRPVYEDREKDKFAATELIKMNMETIDKELPGIQTKDPDFAKFITRYIPKNKKSMDDPNRLFTNVPDTKKSATQPSEPKIAATSTTPTNANTASSTDKQFKHK